MKDSSSDDPLGNAGDLFPVHQDIIASADGSLNPQGSQRPADRLGEAADGQLLRVADILNEGIVQIPEVVVYGSAARHAAHDGDAVFFHEGSVDLLGGVLIQADDDGVPVLPEHEPVALPPVLQNVLFQGEVIAGISGSRLKIVNGHEETLIFSKEIIA